MAAKRLITACMHASEEGELGLEACKLLAAKKNAAKWTGSTPEEEGAVDSWLHVAAATTTSGFDRVLQDMDGVLAHQSFLACPHHETVADLAMYAVLGQTTTNHLPVNVSRWCNQMQALVSELTGVPMNLSAREQRPSTNSTLKSVSMAFLAEQPQQPQVARPAPEITPPTPPTTSSSSADAAKPPPAKEKKPAPASAAAAAAPPAAKKPAPAAPTDTQLLPTMLDIRVGKILTCKKHPEADQLYVETIDLGEAEPRTICSGLVAYYSSADMLVGKLVLVVCNLKPRAMKGIDSNGMVLAASDKGKTKVQLVEAPASAKPGDVVTYNGITGKPLEPNVVNKKKILETVLPCLGTDASCHVVYREGEGDASAKKAFGVLVNGEACIGGSIAEGNVS
jgi:aminoacyl tRNA synthase complex-interacting multifunctional protein 1